ncbi:hypothetical protein D4S03_08695 [bacterium]|nr:MAG: hypothetical protein D4S03_08695 [bacterium]
MDPSRACWYFIDINNDLCVDLTDAIIALRTTSGIISTQKICKYADVSGDSRNLLSRGDLHPPEGGGDEIRKMLSIGNVWFI